MFTFRIGKDIYAAGFKVVDVPLLRPGERRNLTFYTRHGDWFGWTCVAAILWRSSALE